MFLLYPTCLMRRHCFNIHRTLILNRKVLEQLLPLVVVNVSSYKWKSSPMCTNYLKYVGVRSCHQKSDKQEFPKITLMENFVHKMPVGMQPYMRLMRLDKPTGTWLLLWPCYWSLALGAVPGFFPDPKYLALFGVGAILMRGAACTINDLWDKDIDSKVARTKSRPLASRELSSLDAVMFLGGQLSLAALILLQFNFYSIVLGASSLGLVTVYPFIKRISYWPQLFLGFTINWGALLGWAVLHGSCNWAVVLPLYAAGISWTMIYDTIYAHQDKVDDLVINVKSTALKFQGNTKKWLSFFATTSTLCLLTCGYAAEQTWPYFVAVAATSGMLWSQISSLNIDSPEDCWKKFKSNQRIGWIIFSGIVAGTLLKSSQDINKSKNSASLSTGSCLDMSSFQMT